MKSPVSILSYTEICICVYIVVDCLLLCLVVNEFSVCVCARARARVCVRVCVHACVYMHVCTQSHTCACLCNILHMY